MPFPDIVPDLKARMPELRGRLLANQPLDTQSWFRVGGPAQALFMPADENDLAYFLRNLAAEIPVMVIGASSNLIIRDGGIPGVVIRLGKTHGRHQIAELLHDIALFLDKQQRDILVHRLRKLDSVRDPFLEVLIAVGDEQQLSLSHINDLLNLKY